MEVCLILSLQPREHSRHWWTVVNSFLGYQDLRLFGKAILTNFNFFDFTFQLFFRRSNVNKIVSVSLKKRLSLKCFVSWKNLKSKKNELALTSFYWPSKKSLSMLLFWCFCCYFSIYFTPFSIADFKQVNVSLYV